MLSSIKTCFRDLICTTALGTTKSIVSHNIVCANISTYVNTRVFPYIRERVIPHFYANNHFTRLFVGVVAAVAVLVTCAVTAYLCLQGIQRELRQAQAQNAQLQAQVEAHPRAIEALQVQHDALHAHNRELQAQIEAHPRAIEALQVQHDALDVHNRELQAQVKAHPYAMEALQVQHDALDVHNRELQAQVEAHPAALAALQEQNNQLQAQVDAQLGNIEELRESYEKYKTKYQDGKETYQTLAREAKRTSRNLERVQKELAKLKANKAASPAKLAVASPGMLFPCTPPRAPRSPQRLITPRSRKLAPISPQNSESIRE